MSALSSVTARLSFFAASAATGAVGLFLLAYTGWAPVVPSAEAQDSGKVSPPAKLGVAAEEKAVGPSDVNVATANDMRGPAFEPLANEPAGKIVVDPPLAGPLARGVAVIQFRTENLRILPVFGQVAVKVSPRIGHLHVTVDDAPWHLAITSAEPLIVAGLPAGPHKILIELADANHQVLDKGIVNFVIPKTVKP